MRRKIAPPVIAEIQNNVTRTAALLLPLVFAFALGNCDGRKDPTQPVDVCTTVYEQPTCDPLSAIAGSNMGGVVACGLYGEIWGRTDSTWALVLDADSVQISDMTIGPGGQIMISGWFDEEYDDYTAAFGVVMRSTIAGWRQTVVPRNVEPWGNTQLLGIWACESGEGFAVGMSGNIFRVRDAGLVQMTSNTEAWLGAVTGWDCEHVIAVGDDGTVVRYAHSTWELMETPTTSSLQSVWGSSPDDVFAVGDYGTIIHYDGVQWTEMESGASAQLSGVSGNAPDNVYAVGTYGTVLHYDGRAWHRLTETDSLYNTDVWVSNRGDVFVSRWDGTVLEIKDNR